MPVQALAGPPSVRRPTGEAGRVTGGCRGCSPGILRASHRLGGGMLALLRQGSGPRALECPCGAATSQMWGCPCDLETPWPDVVQRGDLTRFWEIERGVLAIASLL